MTVELVVIGGGKMGEALVSGLLTAGWAAPEQLVVVESSPSRRQVLAATGGLADRHPGLAILDPTEVDGAVAERIAANAALIAVKPADVPEACALVRRLGVTRVLSVAAGITIDALTSWVGAPPAPAAGGSVLAVSDGGGSVLPAGGGGGSVLPAGGGGGSVLPAGGDAGGPVVLRAMPNTPALVGAGAAGLAGGPAATEDDLAWAETVLAAVGLVVRVPEASLDAVTGLSGSGPAYVFLIAEALIDAGVLVGLARPVASELAVQTLLGAARMLAETGQPAESLRAAVTSPGGTTAAGLRALEAAAVRSAVIEAVAAATRRSQELGGG
jgi:pyrroline-5-carboxylate reductase